MASVGEYLQTVLDHPAEVSLTMTGASNNAAGAHEASFDAIVDSLEATGTACYATKMSDSRIEREDVVYGDVCEKDYGSERGLSVLYVSQGKMMNPGTAQYDPQGRYRQFTSLLDRQSVDAVLFAGLDRDFTEADTHISWIAGTEDLHKTFHPFTWENSAGGTQYLLVRQRTRDHDLPDTASTVAD